MTINARLVVEVPAPDPARDLAPLSLGPRPRFWLEGGQVHAVDDGLQIVGSRPVSLPPGARLLDASADLRQLVAATLEDTRLVLDDTEHTLPFTADSAALRPGGPAVMTAPSHDGGSHRILLVAPDGNIADEASVPVSQAGAFVSEHPGDGSLLVELGEGQDGSLLVAVRVRAGTLDVQEIGSNSVAAGFSPDGERLLLLPHPSFPAAPRSLSWPDLRLEGSVEQVPGVDYDMYGCYLSSEHVLLKTYEQGLFLADRDLTALEPVALSGLSLDALEGEIESVWGLGERRFAANIWDDGRRRVTVWELPQ